VTQAKRIETTIAQDFSLVADPIRARRELCELHGGH
jgi:hypothetical protein